MTATLALEEAVYRLQRRQIDEAVATASPAFVRYERRYLRATRAWRRAASATELALRVAGADVVYVGDYHTLPASQAGYLRLVDAARRSGRRVVLALEFLERRHQAHLDAFLEGALDEATLRARTGHPARHRFDMWHGFAPVLAYARRQGLTVFAVDRRASGPRSIERRDVAAAAVIAEAAAAPDRPVVLVLVGQYHVVPAHLPARVRQALGGLARRHLTVYQSAEGVYRALRADRRCPLPEVLELDEDELCVPLPSPLACQRSFLNYLEAERGEPPGEEPAVAAVFSTVVRHLARLAEVRARGLLDGVSVASAITPEELARVLARSDLAPRERTAARRAAAGGATYLPTPRLAWLGDAGLEHVGAAAALFLRHAAGGEASSEPSGRRGQQPWRDGLEAAVAALGGGLVTAGAHRAPQGVAQAPRRALALLVDGRRRAPHLAPRAARDAGAALGLGLALAVDAGRLPAQAVAPLFHAKVAEAPALLRHLAGRLTSAAPPTASRC